MCQTIHAQTHGTVVFCLSCAQTYEKWAEVGESGSWGGWTTLANSFWRREQQQQCAIIAKYLKVYIDNVEVAGKAGKVGGKTGKFRVAHRCAQLPFPHRPRCLSAGVYPSALY